MVYYIKFFAFLQAKKSGFSLLFLFSFVLRLPRGELIKLRVASVVVALVFVERGDPRHFVVRQREIEDVEVVADVIDVL